MQSIFDKKVKKIRKNNAAALNKNGQTKTTKKGNTAAAAEKTL